MGLYRQMFRKRKRRLCSRSMFKGLCPLMLKMTSVQDGGVVFFAPKPNDSKAANESVESLSQKTGSK